MNDERLTPGQVSASKEIQRRTGANFHVATRVLPERARTPTYVLYAFFRIADEVVDDPGETKPAEQIEALEDIRAAVKGERDTDDEVLLATRNLCEEFDISEQEIDLFVDSMLMDVKTLRYETFEELQVYLRGSSVAVGEMMVSVMAPEIPAVAHTHAAALAEAFQLTNFIRDVREDVDDYSRIYLPTATLKRFGATVELIQEKRFTPGLKEAIAYELDRAEEKYREGVAGIRYLPEDVQFAVVMAAVLYAEHHRLIRAQGFDVLSNRPTLSWLDRFRAVARTVFHWQLTHDPVVTFERASAVPHNAEDDDIADDYSPGLVAPMKSSLSDLIYRWAQ